MTTRARLLAPCQTHVQARGGAPVRVDGVRVASVLESWLVEEGWWTARPVRRYYWEVLLQSGASALLFNDLRSGTWLRHR